MLSGALLAQERFPRFVSNSLHGGTLPETIAALPDFVRGNLLFLHDSDSAQVARLSTGASEPRALVWDTQGRFFAGFNGHPGSPGFNQLETMEYDESGALPRFRFAGRDYATGAAIAETSCLACHGRSPRPIWGEYPRWPGGYGSVEDIVQPEEAEPFRELATQAPRNPL